MTTLESRAGEHDRFASHLISQVADPLRYYGTRFEDIRKRHAEFAEKLATEREASYADLRKTKAKYDAVCQEVEAKRKKTESSYDKAKHQSAYQQQLLEMNNAKNTYLIAINVTNKLKEKYYHEYVPEVMDSLQDLNEFRTLRLNALWTVASRLEGDMLKKSNEMMETLVQEISRNAPHLDSMMYMRHNMGAFQEPADKTFEPSPVWHDDESMVVDETAKVYLRNVLGKSKSQLGELRREVDKKQREVDGMKRLKERVRDGTEKKDEVEVVRSLFHLQEELHGLDRRRLTAEVETSTITSAVGDVTLGAKNHNFKGQTFKIPTNCDLCGDRIWGLSAKGFDCRDCGYTCHSKCEMKVPADCPGEQTKEERKKLKAERQDAANKLLKPSAAANSPKVAELPDLTRSNTMNSLSSQSARRSVTGSTSGPLSPTEEAPVASPTSGMTSPKPSTRKNRVMAPPPAAYISDMPNSPVNGSGDKEEKTGKMLYTFDASGDGELSVQEGRDLVILEPDGKSLCPCYYPDTDALIRWLWLDQGSRRLQGRHRSSVIRRGQHSPVSRSSTTLVGLLHVHHVVRCAVHDSRQEEGPGRRAQARRQEAAVRRGAVRVHGAERGRALHGRGRALRPRQGGPRRWLGRGGEGGRHGERARQLYPGCLGSSGTRGGTPGRWRRGCRGSAVHTDCGASLSRLAGIARRPTG